MISSRKGVPIDYLMGKSRWELATQQSDNPPGHWEQHFAALNAQLAFRDFEYCVVAPTGVTYWFSISGIPFFDEQGEFLGYRGVGRDISDTHSMQVELQRYRSFLEEEVRKRGSLEGARTRDIGITGKVDFSCQHEPRNSHPDECDRRTHPFIAQRDYNARTT